MSLGDRPAAAPNTRTASSSSSTPSINWIRNTTTAAAAAAAAALAGGGSAEKAKAKAKAAVSRSPPDPHFLPPPELRNLEGTTSRLKKKELPAAQVLPFYAHRPSTMVDPIFDYQFRVILIGDSTVGKSSLLRYFTDGTFAEVSDPTVGVDFFARLLQVNDGTNIKLQLWDTAGQERFRSITKSYYRNSVGALLVYDICNRDSYKHIPVWMMEAKRHIEPHKAVFILVGCKLDLAADEDMGNREVTTEEAREFAEYHQIGFAETSAKTGQNVEESFRMMTQQIYDKIQTGEYKLEDGWDGIKKGYFGLARRGGGTAPGDRRRTSTAARGGGVGNGVGGGGTGSVRLLEGEPASRQCC